MVIPKIPAKVFKQIEKFIPFPSVDVFILKDDKVILTKRSIPPYRGYWHLPGRIIKKG